MPAFSSFRQSRFPEALGEEDNEGFPADVGEDLRFGHGGFGLLLFQC